MKYVDPTRLYVEREKPFVKRDSFSNVDQVGFVTFDQQVRSLILAGERVMAWKRNAYDYPDGEVDEANAKPDPTMDVGFDLADASEILRKVERKVEIKRLENSEEGVNEGKDTSVPSAGEVNEGKDTSVPSAGEVKV